MGSGASEMAKSTSTTKKVSLHATTYGRNAKNLMSNLIGLRTVLTHSESSNTVTGNIKRSITLNFKLFTKPLPA